MGSLGTLALRLSWLLGVGALLASQAAQAAPADDERWQELRGYLFEDRAIQDGAGLFRLEAPERAQDASIVPVAVTALQDQTAERYIKTIHLLVDQNPSPLAGVFHLTPASGRASIATRVRVNEYTNIRAIAETNDGQLWMVSRFVKASGGCSAPSASRDHSQALASLGELRLKPITPFQPGVANQVKLMIRHPNYTGMQKDQLSQTWIPPQFVNQIDVRYGDQTVLSVDSDISLSENPVIEFSFVPKDSGELSVKATDSDDRTFQQSWPIGARPGA